jgi:hypothetical protein
MDGYLENILLLFVQVCKLGFHSGEQVLMGS